jgi:sporulation integral membrane protein YtvI
MVKIRNIIKIPNALNTVICMGCFITLAAIVFWFFGHYLVEGLTYLIDMLSSESTIDSIVSCLQEIDVKLDALSNFFHIEISMSDIDSMVSDFAKKAISILSSISLNVAIKVPPLLMSLIIGCVAAFYMLSDYDNISDIIAKHLSPKTKRYVDVFNNQVLSSFIKMILSYTLVSAICFCELMVGFLILGIKDAVFIAMLIAILDVLPVLGSGTVLIPWGVVSLLLGYPTTGIGVLILYGIITVVRQIVEPKIVGSQIGLHPLVTIASLYIGLRLMGGLGLIMGPLYVLMCKKLAEEGLVFSRATIDKTSDALKE